MDVGAFIDVFTDNPGFVEFTAAETFDYEIFVAGDPIFNRLLDANGGGGYVGPPASVQPNFIDELAAFTVTGGPGILEANNGGGLFLDSGYDATNDGFMWGTIDFKIISNAPFGGANINITGVAGDGTIVNGSDPIDAVFTTATIHIPGPITPEPTTAGFLAICLSSVVIRRTH